MMKSSIGDLKSQIPDLRLKALAILKINHLMRKDEGKGSQISDPRLDSGNHHI